MTGRDEEVYDITIVGAGPTGLFAAFCAGMRGMTVKVLEKLPEPGGQLAVLYPDKYIYDAPGHSKILAKDLVRELYLQSKTFGEPTYCFEEAAKQLSKDDYFIVTTDKGRHYSRTLLIAAGIGAFTPKRLNVPGTEEGRPGIHYFVKDTDLFRDRRVLVVGGGDSAVDWVLSIKDIAKKVTLIHRRDQFRAHESSVRQLMDSPVEVKTFYELKRVYGDARVEGSRIYENRTGQEEDLPVDDIIIAIGFEADLGEIRYWGARMDEQLRHIMVGPSMETNIPGVYAAGDVTELTYLEKLELPESQRIQSKSRLSLPSTKYQERKERWGLIVMGYAQAATAVNHAKQYMTPGAKLFPGHSTEIIATRSKSGQ